MNCCRLMHQPRPVSGCNAEGKESKVTEENIELLLSLRKIQKQINNKCLIDTILCSKLPKTREGRTEVVIMVASRGGLIWGRAHRASKVLANVLFLKVRDVNVLVLLLKPYPCHKYLVFYKDSF